MQGVFNLCVLECVLAGSLETCLRRSQRITSADFKKINATLNIRFIKRRLQWNHPVHLCFRSRRRSGVQNAFLYKNGAVDTYFD